MDPAELMRKYDGGGKKKGKLGHRCRYRYNNYIKDIHVLNEAPKYNDDNKCNNDDNDGDWDSMEEKEQEEDNDDDNDVVNITVVQFFWHIRQRIYWYGDREEEAEEGGRERGEPLQLQRK